MVNSISKNKTITIKKSTFAALVIAPSTLVLLMIIFIVIAYNESRVIVSDSKPYIFTVPIDGIPLMETLDIDFANPSGNFLVIDHRTAAIIAKAHIRAIPDASFFGPYTVYFDEESQMYIVSSRLSLLRPGIHVVIDKASGAVIYTMRGRF